MLVSWLQDYYLVYIETASLLQDYEFPCKPDHKGSYKFFNNASIEQDPSHQQLRTTPPSCDMVFAVAISVG
jgi:hypothetical protein